MKRIVISLFVLVVVLLGAVIVGPGFVDWNKYKPQILAQLHDATGHNYKIDGPIELTLIPYPHLALDSLTVTTPSAAGETPLMKLDKAAVQVALAPLFSGDIEVTKVVLQKPVFQLSVSQNGAQSWMTPELQARTGAGKQSKAGKDGAAIGEAISLNEIEIKDGVFSYTDERSGKALKLEKINLSVQGDSLYGPYAVKGSVVYNDTETRLTLNSGRLDNLAESIALQFEAQFPSMASSVTYAGVIALKDKVELQGETGAVLKDAAAFINMATGMKTAPAWLAKPFNSKGILTVEANEIAYRNLKAGFGGMEGTGAVVVRNYAKGSAAPMDLNVAFETSKPYSIDALLPPTAAPKEKPGAGEAKGLVSLLPETITLPRDFTGAVSVKSAAVQYGGIVYNDVAFSIERKDTGFASQFTFKGPGATVVDINSTIGFGAKSKSEQSGAMTFSDPAVNAEVKLGSNEPHLLVQSFSKAPLTKNMTNLLSNKLTCEAKLRVLPKKAEIESGFVSLGETRIDAAGVYNVLAGRDLLQVNLSSYGIDADQWAKKISGPASPAATPEEQKTDYKEALKAIALPFDADFSATLQNLRLQGRDYSKLAAKGRLTGPQLSLETFQLTSNAGDVFTAAGSVKDIQNVRGIDLTLQANVVDLETTLKSFKVDVARLPSGVGQSEFLAELKGEPEELAFTANLKAMRGTLAASGKLANALAAPVVSDLTMQIQHANYVDVVRLFNPTFNSGVGIKKNLDIFASLSRQGDVYTFSQLQATVGPTQVKGDVVADVSGAKPNIQAALEFTDLPVDELLGIKTAKAGAVSAQPMNSGGQDVRWSRNAINVSGLHKANVALKATAQSITYGNWNFKNAGINIDLKDGVLNIQQMDGGMYGGHVAVTGVLKSSAKERQPISFDGKALAQNVSLEEFVRSFSGSRLIKATGSVSLETTLATTGLSPAALIFDLKGKGTATGSNLVFEGFDLARLSQALASPTSSFTENFGRLLDATMSGGSTTFDTLDGAYTISEGVIRFDKMQLAGPSSFVDTAGTVSLPLWTLDLVSTVKLREPEDAPELRASFKGPIDKPGQTFGQNAMQQYFMQQIQGTLLSPNADKINKTLDKIDGSGALKTLLGVEGPAPKAPEPQAPVVPQEQTQQQPPVQQQPVQQQQQQQQQKPMTPEDALFGVIQGVLGGQ